ncbi:hypothetical protein DYD21_07060 [Rhodohalobacter sp. SW132]|uniref:Wzz/FepE/Etk N-terminal domain-containing protein n=1 Tax=Rhodohalobacter sp. SW132 TaxID=2293433 RepID=UPI000E283543|nr:Wzz/FepE/Etk N-terminal domain-containing protein [Rhodohalobacter sp. SW132]REL37544.1 hypothetical protein DYD21_07060 [Rhodohalobacter sp. SW132]
MSDELNNNPGSPEELKKEKETTPEVRYVPIEYMPHINEGDDDEIDLVELAKNIWNGRWTIAKITGVFVAIGLFIAFFSPVEYESEAILMPEVQQADQGRAGQLLQRFGGAFGMGGVDLSQAQHGTIPPMIYPRIVNSLSFQMELMEQEIRFADYTLSTTLPDFYENHYSPSLTQYLQKLTIGLPFTVLDWIREEERTVQVNDPFEAEFIQVSKKDLELIDNIRNRISVRLDEETGLLTTRVTLHDARAAAELNRHLIELLKEYVTQYRIEKTSQDLEFVEEQHASARERFEERQIALADFRDANISLATARAQTELERLQDEKDLAFNLYSSLSQQLEEARLRLQEQRPVFSVVQAVNVPSDKISPRRGFIVMITLILGISIGIGFWLIKFYLK